MRWLGWLGFTFAASLAIVLPAGGGMSKHSAGGTTVKFLPGGTLAQPPAWAAAAPKAGGLAVDANGNIFISAWNPPTAPPGGRSDIAVFDRNGNFVRTFGVGIRGSTATLLATGPGGLVYATISGGSEGIAVYTSTGVLVRTIGQSAALKNVHDLEVDAAGNVYLANDDPPSVVRLDAAGNVTARWPISNAGSASPRVRGLALAPDGSVYVTRGFAKHPLVHLDANGKELSDAPKLEVLLSGGGHVNRGGHVNDVDLVAGLLYVAHLEQGLAVLTTAGKIVDRLLAPTGTKSNVTQVAVGGKDVYSTGYPADPGGKLAAGADPFVKRFGGVDIPLTRPDGVFIDASGCENAAAEQDTIPPIVSVPAATKDKCALSLYNSRNSCPNGFKPSPSNSHVFVGAYESYGAKIDYDDLVHVGQVTFDAGTVTEGSVVILWSCTAPGKSQVVFEWKGEIILHDPSGSILDATTGRPVRAAAARLEFAPTRKGPFGKPGGSGIEPQVNPEVTGSNGLFGWNVADGFWRIRVRAYGYKRFTSPKYKVPPPVTGLKLKLAQDPAQQRLLIDPSGRVGKLRLGAASRQGRRIAGLAVRITGGKVRRIDVHARRFRTAEGVKIGSPLSALQRAYPRGALRSAKGRLRLARATFTIKRGRVVAIRIN